MLTNQTCQKFLEDISIASHLSFVFILNEQSFTFRVMSLVVINGRYIFKKKKTCEDLMWRDAGELYAHAIQVKKKVQYETVWDVGLLGER